MSLEDEEGRGRPSVSISTVSRHLQAIDKLKKLDKLVPHELNEKQEEKRSNIAALLRKRNQNQPFLDRMVTCDEKWFL